MMEFIRKRANLMAQPERWQLRGAFPYFRSTYKKGAMLALNTKAG